MKHIYRKKLLIGIFAAFSLTEIGQASVTSTASQPSRKEKLQTRKAQLQTRRQQMQAKKATLQKKYQSKMTNQAVNQQPATASFRGAGNIRNNVAVQCYNDNNDNNVLTQSIDEETNVTTPVEILPATQEHVLESKPIQETITPSIHQDETAEHLVQAAQVAQNLTQVAPANSAQQPTVEIVRTYPVYDAVKAGIESIKSAMQDMVNYLYSFVNNKK